MQVLARIMKTERITSIRLAVEDPGATAAIAAVAATLVSTAEPRLSISLDGETLPAPVVAALVTALRRLREVGGALEVVPTTAALRDQFAIHGLSRVFAFPLPPDEEPRPRRLGRGLRQSIRIGAALAFAWLALGAPPAPAQDEILTDVPAILGRVIDRNPNLESYEGRLHVQVKLTSFPYLHERLDGTTYFKRPSNYEVVFDRVPWYARGFDKLYTDVGDPAGWQRRFVVTYAGLQSYDGHSDVVLRMVQRVRGMIDHETVLVDPGSWAIDEIRYDYYNGGTITMTQQFRDVAGYRLLAGQTAQIAIPHVHAVATASYDGYRTNVAIDESVFQKGDGQ
jgi:hypothetical protein